LSLSGAWYSSKQAPVPVEALKKSATESGLDLLLAREEFGRAAESIGSGASSAVERGVDRSSVGQIFGGLGLGAGTAATFFLPGARVGRYAGGGLRGARAGVLRAAAGLGDAADGLVVGPTNVARVESPRWLPEVVSGQGVEASPLSRAGYPEAFEPVMLPNLGKVYTRDAVQVSDYGNTTWGSRSTGPVWESDGAAGRLRFFHGTSNRGNVDEILSSGIRPSENGQYGRGVYGSSSLTEAIDYGKPRVTLSSRNYSREAADEARRAALNDDRYIFEFVTDPDGIDDLGPKGAPFGNALVSGPVEPDSIVAIHVFSPAAPSRQLPPGVSVNRDWLLKESIILKPGLRSAVEDFGVLPRMSNADIVASRAADAAAARISAGNTPTPKSGAEIARLTTRQGDTFGLREDVSVRDFDRALDAVAPLRVSRPGRPLRTVEETVYRYTPEEYANMKLFVSEDGLSGFALKPDGDLVSVFSAPGLGRAEALLDVAIANGARKLDAFDEGGFLPRLYGSKGFVETGRVPWDPEQKPGVWRGGEPDVVYMELPADGGALPPPLQGVRGAVGSANMPEMRRAVVEWQETARKNVLNDPSFVDELAQRMIDDIDVPEMARLWALEGNRRGFGGRIPSNVRTIGGEIVGGTPQSPLSGAGLIPSRFLNPGDEPFAYAARWMKSKKKEDLLEFSRSIQRLRLNQSFGLDETVRGGAPWYLDRAARTRAISSAILDDSGRVAYDPVFVASVMAGFSAGAPPILEPVRALFALPFVRESGGKLVFDIDAFAAAYPSLAPLKDGQPLSGYNTWGAEVAAALGNDLDITRRYVKSLSDKTFPYAVATIDPTNPFALVIDRNAVYQAAGHNVFGEFTTASGAKVKLINPFNESNATQQMLGFHALAHGVSRGVDGIPMGQQERGWFPTRIMLQSSIGESFWLPPGVARERKQMLSTDPLMEMVFDPTQAQSWDEISLVAFDGMGSAFGADNVRRVRRVAADTREKFVERVQRGELDDWEMLDGQPVVRRDKWERVLPPKRRYMPATLGRIDASGLTAAELAATGTPIKPSAMLDNGRQIIEQARGPFGDWLRSQYNANPGRTLALLAMLVPAATFAATREEKARLTDWTGYDA